MITSLFVLLYYALIHATAITIASPSIAVRPSSSRVVLASQRTKWRTTSTREEKRCRTRYDGLAFARTSSSSSSPSTSPRDCYESISPVLSRVHRGGGDFLGTMRQSDKSTQHDHRRGGAGSKVMASQDDGNSNMTKTNINNINNNNKNNNVMTTSISIISLIAIATTCIINRDGISSSLSKASIIHKMNIIASHGNAGLILYACGFAIWEVCGLPTSVVETAASMAFGLRRGLLGSFVGKSCGSCIAFALGRTLLSNIVSRRLEGTEPYETVVRGAAGNPILAAFVVRYSVFPQLVKNYGMSLCKPVSFSTFFVSIVVHGFPFSLLWAALGQDAGLRLRASEAGMEMAANILLNGLLAFVTIFGFVVSPTITGLWLADLRK
jgi:uncharacterized membrane protein YdjX (TVP38/TMEM64 family)